MQCCANCLSIRLVPAISSRPISLIKRIPLSSSLYSSFIINKTSLICFDGLAAPPPQGCLLLLPSTCFHADNFHASRHLIPVLIRSCFPPCLQVFLPDCAVSNSMFCE